MPWSEKISTDHPVKMPPYPKAALVDVEFQCTKCGRTHKICVEITQGIGWGWGEIIDCDCGETYDIMGIT
ncbi:MAG: hypothetical protein NWE84_04535 [Candidatus Bathyarchaeota archaeon]|nr:hypothetical protein [Candidatus Bathyarchaeota archaeon]